MISVATRALASLGRACEISEPVTLIKATEL